MNSDNELLMTLPPGKLNFNIGCSIDDWRYLKELEDRRLYLYGPVTSLSGAACSEFASEEIVDNIINYNRLDQGIEPKKRKPIRLYINSPGGDVNDGFAIISAIETSKTPIYTINVGQWSSMAFLIGIAGKKRYSLPYSMFLMHDGSQIALGSSSKVQDQIDFSKKFEDEVIKQHVLKHSNMKSTNYDALARVEYYMLPKDALEYEFIDEIVTDIDTIL